jgi:hypothetical protein
VIGPEARSTADDDTGRGKTETQQKDAGPRFDLGASLKGLHFFLRTNVVTSVFLTLLPVVIGILFFFIVPEIYHNSMLRWHEGVLVLLFTLLIEFPYAKYILPPLSRRVMLTPAKGGA